MEGREFKKYQGKVLQLALVHEDRTVLSQYQYTGKPQSEVIVVWYKQQMNNDLRCCIQESYNKRWFNKFTQLDK